ncbi:hypothetical protein AX16_009814 [Volvariella volvacea WC 439]|nr:hypothetical protein AX16_009814 [Volvariella volvacea WC 439]
MKISTFLTFIGALTLPSAVNAYRPPGADTPAFHLVSSSTSGSSNLLPVRIDNSIGGYATLTGSQPIAIFYFTQGRLVAAPPPGGNLQQLPIIDAQQIGNGVCTTYGAWVFHQGSNSNRCAKGNAFYIQSNPENAQLGARLTFDWQGGFYACGADKRIYYKLAPGDGPQGCDPVDLWTVAARWIRRWIKMGQTIATLFLATFTRSIASPVPIPVSGSTIPSPVCIVAAAITASRCDPTRTRTIFDILYSCIGVTLLCTYISIHHNIPDQNDPWAQVTWLKLRTTFYALIAPEMVILWAIRQRIMAGRIAKENKHRRWTRTHGFFVQMGGLMQRVEVDGEVTYRVAGLTTEDDKDFDWSSIKIPQIPEKEIKDHGKGDILAKTIVVIQTTWFVAQCIARHAQGLVLTEIELVTLAFATLNVITYGLWWDKPLNIEYPIYFDENGNRVDGPLATHDELEDGEVQMGQDETWYGRTWRSVKGTVAGWDESTWEGVGRGWGESIARRGVVKTMWRRVIVAPFLVVFAPLWGMMTDVSIENKPTSAHSFYAAAMNLHDRLLATISGSAIGVVFGAIHLIGWNFQFPTTTEQWLWRASSLILTIVPFLLVLTSALALAPKRLRVESLEYVVLAFAYPCLFLGPPLYFAARFVLLFLAFFTLRSLPDSAYQNVRWTEFIPHI